MTRPQVDLHIRWVPRALNSQADSLSKLSDSADWRLNPRFFAILDKLRGPHTLDAFASAENAHCAKFFSKYRCPGAAGCDAFAFPWHPDVMWLNPPFGLIGQALAKIREERGKGYLNSASVARPFLVADVVP